MEEFGEPNPKEEPKVVVEPVAEGEEEEPKEE